MNKHGRTSYQGSSPMAHNLAVAYDLCYNLMTPDESAKIRKAFIDKWIIPTYRFCIYDNFVPNNTSNWIGHMVG
jgi:hypothetical protein